MEIDASPSVTSEHLVCLVCATKLRMLRRHIGAAHQMTPDEYRAAFDLPRDYPMILPGIVVERRKSAASSEDVESNSGHLGETAAGGGVQDAAESKGDEDRSAQARPSGD